MASNIQGPGIYLAQFAGDSAPFNSWPAITKWAASLGFTGVQIPSWDGRLFDLANAAESKTYCDEIAGIARDNGVAITDIRRILLTHAHLDHAGLAAWIVEQSGAEVWLHPDEVGKLESPDWWTLGRNLALNEAGVPAETQAYMDRWWQRGRQLMGALSGWKPLHDGQRFEFEHGALEAVHLPGHALGHTGFFDAAGGVLVGGDHLLDGVTPNPIMEPVLPGHPAAVPHAPGRALTLGQFLGALERVLPMPVRTVLPGHGPVITDHAKVARGYLARHEARRGTLRARLG